MVPAEQRLPGPAIPSDWDRPKTIPPQVRAALWTQITNMLEEWIGSTYTYAYTPVMKLSVSVSGAVPVGPEHLTFDVPERAHIEVVGNPPYDLDIHLAFSDEAQRLEITELTLKRQDGGEPLRMADFQQVRLSDLIETSLVGEVLDKRGWPGIVADREDVEPEAVDALVYRVSYALFGQRPTQIVAEARGLKPGSSIKRVMRAREMGYLGPAHKGRSGI